MSRLLSEREGGDFDTSVCEAIHTFMNKLAISDTLVCRLVATQFPQWKNLPVQPVAKSGWDNRTFHLGQHMLVRLPSAAEYALQVEKEQRWLPRLAPCYLFRFLCL